MRNSDIVNNLEMEINAKPYHAVSDFEKWQRGDMPYFYNQSRKTRNQINTDHYNSQFCNDKRTLQKADYINQQL